jgi:hypothetical protein
MGTFTAPKNGRSRQSFGGDHHEVLKHSADAPAKVCAPKSQNQAAHLKAPNWNIHKHSAKKC